MRVLVLCFPGCSFFQFAIRLDTSLCRLLKHLLYIITFSRLKRGSHYVAALQKLSDRAQVVKNAHNEISASAYVYVIRRCTGDKGKAISVQAVKAHRVVRHRGSNILSIQSAHRWR
jgi:hypothetical protein